MAEPARGSRPSAGKALPDAMPWARRRGKAGRKVKIVIRRSRAVVLVGGDVVVGMVVGCGSQMSREVVEMEVMDGY